MAKRRDLSPSQIKRLILNYIDEESIDVISKYGGVIQKALVAQGKLEKGEKLTFDKFSSINPEEIFDIVGEKILAARARRDEMETPEVETAINENIEAFLLEMDAQFETMAGAFTQSRDSKGKKVKAAKSTKENVNQIIKFVYDMIESQPEA